MMVGLTTEEAILKVRKGLFIAAIASLLICSSAVCLLDNNSYEFRVIVSGSMEGEPTDYPISTIPKGSIVLIDRVSDFGIGDVIAFNMDADGDNIVVVHRVIGIDGTVITHGDANPPGSVEYVEGDQVIGKVTYVNSTVGNVIWIVKNNIPSLILILILASFISFALSNIIKEIKKGDDI